MEGRLGEGRNARKNYKFPNPCSQGIKFRLLYVALCIHFSAAAGGNVSRSAARKNLFVH